MGMELMFPPDVDGWVSGEQWISTATVVELRPRRLIVVTTARPS